MHKTKGVFKV